MARSLVGAGHRVWGTTRNLATAHELRESGVEGVLQLDLGYPPSIDSTAELMQTQLDGLDVLVNNAGVGTSAFGVERADAGPWEVGSDVVLDVVRVNALGPMLLTRALLPLLVRGDAPLVLNVSSQLGSMVVGPRVADTPYNVSKAALNMITVMMAASRSDISFVCMHPGWVRTDMGGAAAPLAAGDAGSAIATTLLSLTGEDSGRFINWDGSNHPW